MSSRLRALHGEAVTSFARAIDAVPVDRWHRPPASGRWSSAALSLHVIEAYEYCERALAGGPQMRTRLPAWRMWMLRELVMPVMFRLRRFPRDAPAPSEVVPDLSAAVGLSQVEARTRLIQTAERTVAALEKAAVERPEARVAHAYFGAMSPRQTLVLLAAHTRHHVEGLKARSSSERCLPEA